MNNNSELINISRKELDELIDIQRRDSYIVGYELALTLVKDFIELNKDQNGDKLLNILNFQLQELEVIKKEYESN